MQHYKSHNNKKHLMDESETGYSMGNIPMIGGYALKIEKRVLDNYIEQNYVKYLLLNQCMITDVSQLIMTFVFKYGLNICYNDYGNLSYKQVDLLTNDIKIVNYLDKIDVLVIDFSDKDESEFEEQINVINPTFILLDCQYKWSDTVDSKFDQSKIYFNKHKINEMKCEKDQCAYGNQIYAQFGVYLEKIDY